jgi:hypothetical protein
MKITVEAPRQKNHIVHCTRCQSYGHTKPYCAKPYACVKCGGNNTLTCTKPSNSRAKCVLCVGKYPASYNKYEVYKNLKKKNRGKQINQIAHRPTQQRIKVSDKNQFPPINPNQTPIQMPLAPQISYSQALQQNQQPLYDIKPTKHGHQQNHFQWIIHKDSSLERQMANKS